MTQIIEHFPKTTLHKPDTLEILSRFLFLFGITEPPFKGVFCEPAELAFLQSFTPTGMGKLCIFTSSRKKILQIEFHTSSVNITTASRSTESVINLMEEARINVICNCLIDLCWKFIEEHEVRLIKT